MTPQVPRLSSVVRVSLACLTVITIAIQLRAEAPPKPVADDEPIAVVSRFAEMALECVHRPYPYKLTHVLQSDADARTPRELTPIFYGCFDWHSAVHGHWMLVRLIRLYPEAPFADRARAALAQSFTPESVAAEVAYLSGKGRRSFERPYGLAWFLQLSAELHEWDDPQARAWAAALEPLEAIALKRLTDWLPKLSHPVRSGTHDQTAFALGLIYDWAKCRGRADVLKLVEERARHFYLRDRGANLAFEPGGQDFLSPAIAEADVMRRILPPVEFAAWLGAFLPELPVDGSTGWLEVAVVTDRSDGHLVHLDGLNLSRAWMLEGVSRGLPAGDPRAEAIRKTAAAHYRAGLDALAHQEYEGGHWLGSFATYMVTRRGMGE